MMPTIIAVWRQSGKDITRSLMLNVLLADLIPCCWKILLSLYREKSDMNVILSRAVTEAGFRTLMYPLLRSATPTPPMVLLYAVPGWLRSPTP